jgi:hypothetical protein
MFNNNRLLRGSIPLFDTSKFTRIRNYSGYVEGVNKSSITNATTFIGMHESGWVPQTWIEQNG